MVSMKDIAKACGVSVATVSKALSGQPDIGEQTRELICKTAESSRLYDKLRREGPQNEPHL